jgi:sec-independent protein translocase protein TatC
MAAISAVLTPPDLLSQILLLVPMVLLYEMAIIAIMLTRRRAAKKAMASPENAASKT